MGNEKYSPQFLDNDAINIRAELEKYLIHWKWFFLSVLIALLGAFFYLRYSTPKYNASATILIKNDKKGGISDELAAFEDLGIVGGSSKNIDNEIEIIKSRKLITHVINKLNLNIKYITEGRVKDSEIYLNKPFSFIRLDSINEINKLNTFFSIQILSNVKFNLLDFNGNTISQNQFNQVINDPNLGKFKISKSDHFSNKFLGQSVKIIIQSLNRTIDSYKRAINISPINKKSSVLKITLQSSIKEKAEDIINELITQYNLDAIKG